jgi:hypothetical protein
MRKTDDQLVHEMEVALGADVEVGDAPRTIAGLARLPRMQVRLLYQKLVRVSYPPSWFMGMTLKERARVVRDLLLERDRQEP